MDMLGAMVERRTTIGDGYRKHAAHQSMSVYLADWEQALARLTRQVEELRRLRDERIAEVEAGTWPPPRKDAS